jgi:superfamily I DNA/RNA helicase
MQFSDKIEKKKIDDLFNYVNKFKEKKNEILGSEKIQSNCKILDNNLIQIANSKSLEKTINFIEGINTKTINDFLGEVSLLSPILESKNKEEFKNECKKFIREEICKCYEKFLKPKLKECVIKICEDIIEVIDKKINKK